MSIQEKKQALKKNGVRDEDRGVQDGEVSSGSSLCCYDSRLCWHALELALPSPLASGHPGECVCVVVSAERGLRGEVLGV